MPLADSYTKKRLPYAQVLFVFLAFAVMALASYLFVSNLENLNNALWFLFILGLLMAVGLSAVLVRIHGRMIKAEERAAYVRGLREEQAMEKKDEILHRVSEERESAEKMVHWYHSILDAIPLPITVTDANMNWTFVNTAVENFLGTKRKDMMGKPCSEWNAHICKTDKCGIACVKRGVKQTYFNQNGRSFKVDVEILKDLNGETDGFIEVVQDVTAIETMGKRQAEAEAASKAKSAFLATVSHEIRTPMNAILGIAEIHLRDENLSPDAAGKAFGKIYESGDLLLNIINDILDLSKIEADKLDLLPVKYDIPSLINDTTQLNSLRYENKSIRFNIQVDVDTPLELIGDELRIRQVLNNILTNAFKYTTDGVIELHVSGEPVQCTEAPDADVDIVFRISDTGQGMAEEQANRLFDKYARSNDDANRTTVGVGLGMSITKRLVDMMHGSIAVESELGKGTVFTIRIPQKRAGTTVCGAELAEKLRNFCFQSMSFVEKTQFPREYMPYGSVLVVDDVGSNLYVAKGMMAPYGLKIETAASGFEAIEKIQNGNVYDIVFMDHMMPKMDGIEATKNIRDMGYTHKIVALTANALIGREEMFLQNGFDAFIPKPLDSRKLDFVLNEYIRNTKPPEVVELARQAQREKEQKCVADNTQNITNESELKLFFVLDAKNAISILERLRTRIHDLDDEEIESYTITVHGMKSALVNVGEKRLAEIAYKLERAGKERNLTVMSNETPAFMGAIQSLITKFKPTEESRDVEISDEGLAFLREKLLGIRAACEEFNINSANAALEQLKQKRWPNHVNNTLDVIAAHLLHSAFDEAAEAAGSIA